MLATAEGLRYAATGLVEEINNPLAYWRHIELLYERGQKFKAALGAAGGPDESGDDRHRTRLKVIGRIRIIADCAVSDPIMHQPRHDQLGICPADEMRYADKPDPRRKPSVEALAESQSLRQRWQVEWIKRWSLDSALTDRELLKIKRALANGYPVACGLRWPKKLHGSELLAVPPPYEVFDGHSIVLVGYEDDPAKPRGGAFLFRNSMGPAWGNHGYGVMSYAYVAAYANDALWLRLRPPGSEVPTVRYEAESMPVLAKAKSNASSQNMSDFHAPMWSGGRQLFCGAERGGSIDLGFEIPVEGRYRIRVLATAAPDFGVVHASLDGKTIGPTVDLYAGRVCPAGSLELGEFHFQAGRHRLRITAVDKNLRSKNYFFGLDAVDLIATK